MRPHTWLWPLETKRPRPQGRSRSRMTSSLALPLNDILSFRLAAPHEVGHKRLSDTTEFVGNVDEPIIEFGKVG